MIVVTGSGRSGTSMWMQILEGAGVPVLGQAMPAGFDPSLNPHGYYESSLIHGINHTSNPDPQTGLKLEPGQALAVKVLADGVRLTERAYLDRVLLSYRHWRPYAASMRRWRALQPELPPHPSDTHPELWWFCLHYGLLHDAMTRRYPLLSVRYGAVVSSPRGELDRVWGWIGIPVDREAALARVSLASLPQREPEAQGRFGPAMERMLAHLGGEGTRRGTLRELAPVFHEMLVVLQGG